MSIEKKELRQKSEEILHKIKRTLKDRYASKERENDLEKLLSIFNDEDFKKYKFFNINTPIYDGFSAYSTIIEIVAREGTPRELQMVIDTGGKLDTRGDFYTDIKGKSHSDNLLSIVLKSMTYWDNNDKEHINNKYNKVKILLESGYNIESKNSFGETALFDSFSMSDTKLFDLIMEYKPNLNVTNNRGETILEKASELHGKRGTHTVKELFKAGTKTTVKALNKALKNALYTRNKEVIVMLLDAGADVNPKVPYDKTPLAYVEGRKEYIEIEKILRKRGAKTKNEITDPATKLINKFTDVTTNISEAIENKIDTISDKREAKKAERLKGNKDIEKLNKLGL